LPLAAPAARMPAPGRRERGIATAQPGPAPGWAGRGHACEAMVTRFIPSARVASRPPCRLARPSPSLHPAWPAAGCGPQHGRCRAPVSARSVPPTSPPEMGWRRTRERQTSSTGAIDTSSSECGKLVAWGGGRGVVGEGRLGRPLTCQGWPAQRPGDTAGRRRVQELGELSPQPLGVLPPYLKARDPSSKVYCQAGAAEGSPERVRPPQSALSVGCGHRAPLRHSAGGEDERRQLQPPRGQGDGGHVGQLLEDRTRTADRQDLCGGGTVGEGRQASYCSRRAAGSPRPRKRCWERSPPKSAPTPWGRQHRCCMLRRYMYGALVARRIRRITATPAPGLVPPSHRRCQQGETPPGARRARPPAAFVPLRLRVQLKTEDL
jgi:hypothetical protein